MKLKNLLLALCLSIASIASAQTPIEFIVKSSVGGPDDIVTRKLAEEIERKSTIKIVVVNKPGAAHVIGYSYFESKNTPSLIIADSNIEKHPVFTQSEKIFSLGNFTNIMYVKRNAGISNFKDLVELSKKRDINFGHGGEGTYGHTAAVSVCEKTLKCLLVPYKSGAPGMLDVLVGTIDAFSLISYGADVYMNNSSYLPILMYSNSKHPKYDIPVLPNSMRNMEIKNWIAIFGRNISDKDRGTIQSILNQQNSSFYTDSGLWYK